MTDAAPKCPKCAQPATKKAHATIKHIDVVSCRKCGDTNVSRAGALGPVSSKETEKLPAPVGKGGTKPVPPKKMKGGAEGEEE